MRSWRDLAEVTTIDAAPFSSYAFGELYVKHVDYLHHFISLICLRSAQLEYLLLNYFNKCLDSYNMQFCSAVNVLKSFVIEAFGYHFSDIKNVFNIVGIRKSKELETYNFEMPYHEQDDDENSVELLHLFGTSTPLGIISPFIRTIFGQDALPYYVYSIGRNYSPQTGQSSCIELLGKRAR